MTTPIFVSFEGIDGSGKSTQAQHLHNRLIQAGRPAILVREPGSTPLGEHLRAYLKSREPITAMAELLLFQSARAELVSTVIKPALEAGTSVVTDRYTDSSIAYQARGRMLPIGTVSYLNDLSTNKLQPNVTFILAIDPQEALKRTTDTNNRFEDQDISFYNRVVNGYQHQADQNPDRVMILNALDSEEKLAGFIWGVSSQMLGPA